MPRDIKPSRQFSVELKSVPIATSGSALDRASITLPAEVTRWIPIRTQYQIRTAAGTVAAAQFGIYTGAAATGTTIVTAAALTAMTAADKTISPTTIALATVLTATTIYLHQTVDAANAGTMDVVVECLDLT